MSALLFPEFVIICLFVQLACNNANAEECMESNYLQHYYAKGCLPIKHNDCPTRFVCPKYSNRTETNVCRYQKKAYDVGESIAVTDPCRRHCRCVKRKTTKPQIECVFAECPEMVFNVKAQTNCYFAYEKDSCCGQESCFDIKNKPRTCSYNGQTYNFKTWIYPDEDRCLKCLCDESWNPEAPLRSGGCQKIDCQFDLDAEFKEGCLPIYHEQSCCPIEYFCPSQLSNKFSSSQTPYKIWNGTSPHQSRIYRVFLPTYNQCNFNDKYYVVGETLNIGNECVECKCKIPPELTCIYRSNC